MRTGAMSMGLTGSLISTGSLAAPVASLQQDARVDAAHRSFRQVQRASLRLGPASSLRSILEASAEPLATALGYRPADVYVSPPGSRGDLVILHADAGGALVPWIVAAWGGRLDPLWRSAVLRARMLQSRWTLLFNGTHLRLLDASSTHARRWIEFDVARAADDRAAFTALWLVVRAEAMGGGLAGIVAASDAFAAGLCRSLRDGVRAASEQLLAAFVSHRRTADVGEALEQALTVVYRILFLLFAESRGLVPMWHPVYRDNYSIDSLRAAAERGRVDGLWDALRAICRLAQAGCRAGDLHVTPFNGRLFDLRRTPALDRRDLDDQAAGLALLALATRPSHERGGRERIAFRDLGVEQLGAVYETLLDYEPTWDRHRPSGAGGLAAPDAPAIRLRPGSGARKATGAFYTPDSIARYLVRQTLAPLVRDRSPDEILALRVLDPSMGSGAFLVSACLFLADAYEDALVRSGRCLPHEVEESDRARIRRQVAERCLFGVDVNPMAVQLARLSLWLATLAHDRPLSFLDHHIRAGDSLIGAWVVSLSRAPGAVRHPGPPDTPPLFDVETFAPTARSLLPGRLALCGPGETVEQVRRKEQLLDTLQQPDAPLARWRRIADLWCAAWFTGGPTRAARSAYDALRDAVLDGRGPLPAHVTTRHIAEATATARRRRFFHWELEFPEVFFDADGRRDPGGGFDAVIGNPPWDMVRGDTGSAGDRARMRDEAVRLVRFARDSGVYESPTRGHVNRYQLFVERSVALLREGGRWGLVLPGGLLVDHSSGSLRQLILSRCVLDGLVTFDNRRGIFPIHRSVRFGLLTATKGASTGHFGARLGESDPAILERDDSGSPDWFPVQLSGDMLHRLSGDDLVVPDVRSPLDVQILERCWALFPALGSRSGWQAQFGRELNATDDAALLRPAGEGLPVIEGKHLWPFSVRVAHATRAIATTDAVRRLGARISRTRLAYRDVASATNRQTLIAALLPGGCASTHTVFCLKTPLSRLAQHCLCGLFNSYVVNFLVRRWVSTHVTTVVVERLPLPTLAHDPVGGRRIAVLARRLSHNRSRVGAAAALQLAELNAIVARLYQLTWREYAHVLDTFPLVPAEERTRALDVYRGKPEKTGVGDDG